MPIILGKKYDQSQTGYIPGGLSARYSIDSFSSTQSSVNTWADSTSNNLDLTANGGGVSVVDDNGQLAVKTGNYDSSERWLENKGSNTVFESNDFTWAFVARYWRDMNDPDRQGFGGTFDYNYRGYLSFYSTFSGTTGHDFRIGRNNGAVQNFVTFDDRIDPFNEYALHVSRKNGNQVDIWANSAGPYNFTSNFDGNNHRPFYLGGFYYSFKKSDAYFLDVLIYDTALSDTDIEALNVELTNKYNLISYESTV